MMSPMHSFSGVCGALLCVERFPFQPELVIRGAFQHIPAFRTEKITLIVRTGVIEFSKYLTILVRFDIDFPIYISVIGHLILLIQRD